MRPSWAARAGRLATMLAISVSIATAATGGGILTYPPAPGSSPDEEACMSSARAALLSGRVEEAYKLVLLARPGKGETQGWKLLAATVYLGLEEPLRAVELLASAGKEDPEAGKMASVVMSRQVRGEPAIGIPASGARLKGPGKEALKDIREVLPLEGGRLALLGKERFAICSDGGAIEANIPLQGARDLVTDRNGDPLALGAGQVYWRGRMVPIPGGLGKPLSAAEAPEGRLLLLTDSPPALYKLDISGKVEGKKGITVEDPSKVRCDSVGRIYISDGSGRTISVFSPSLRPLRVISPECRGKRLREVSNIFVDFAGDLLVLDLKGDLAVLYSAKGSALGATREGGARVDAAGWDGYSALVYLNRKEGYLARMEL